MSGGRSLDPLRYDLATAIDSERHRGEARRHAHERGLRDTRVARWALGARLAAAFMHAVRRDRHSLTDYQCRLADGKVGRVAVVMSDGEWTLVCRAA